MSTAIRIKNNKNFSSYIRAIFPHYFNPCVVIEKMTSFSPILNQDLEQGKLVAAVGNKGPKTASSNVRNRWKFGKITRKDLLCTYENVKNGYQ